MNVSCCSTIHGTIITFTPETRYVNNKIENLDEFFPEGPKAKSAASPLLTVWGAIPENAPKAVIELDPARAIATALKPADEESAGGLILRLREVAGRSEPLSVCLKGYAKALLTDLLERDISELKIVNDKVTIDLNTHGFSSLRLLP